MPRRPANPDPSRLIVSSGKKNPPLVDSSAETRSERSGRKQSRANEIGPKVPTGRGSIIRVGKHRGAPRSRARPRRFIHEGVTHILSYRGRPTPTTARFECSCREVIIVESRNHEDLGEWYAAKTHQRRLKGS